ncbi:MAG: RNA polymerase sigma factor [Clostridia bacterium]|nr:RNA polymerase sigma factor [Clostridia bacterium]
MLFLFLTLTDNEGENDKLIFEEIYDNYKDAAMKRALRLLNGNRVDAEEAFQEAWITIAQNIDKLRSRNEHVIATYVFQTIKYKAINVASSNDQWRQQTEALSKDEAEFVSDDLLFTVCAKESRETIAAVFRSIDEIYRDVLIFYFLHGFSVKEIASQMGMKERSVWTKLYRGKQILMEELRKVGISNE